MSGSNIFTKSLVTVQFALSIGLIICTMIILQQTNSCSKNPGFNKENIVVVDAKEQKQKKLSFIQTGIDHTTDIAGVQSELGLGKERMEQFRF